MIEKTDALKETISIKNAGIVLINSYIPMLFDRLGLMKNQAFSSEENQLKAVHYLQYLAKGLSYTEEFYLPLHKLLCGIPMNKSVSKVIDISPVEQGLMNGLLNAVINYWPSIGSTSVDGFRGNWLVRDGLLTEQEERWELQIEKRAYDILINKSPFAFSIIKYRWMDKPLHVNWPF
ncbi:contractile injection system tape measure protein [Chryseobacterium sp. SL1]|uniref:contractile injection system tape measure protein n=1 Tax=Chryseobacterium sp. SL1 TaxID=2995159 RepID=UPI00227656CA|nr:contractile injection system tape measure protein [Chryseobacterium sp. SL1]MCY1662590.1 contractile injection system tape measure protein [Chryseobacterium sp. SL1]